MQNDFLSLLLTGKYLPAVGLALIAIVAALRSIMTQVSPWFATKPGGYVVGFGSATLLYVGAALQAGTGLSLAVVAGALGAGWAASGGFEMVRDLIDYFKSKGAPLSALPKAVALAMVIGFVSVTACKPYLPPQSYPLVDCITADRTKIDPLIAGFWPKDGGAPDWSALESQAISAGLDVGGCALSEFVERYLAPAPGTRAPDPFKGALARATFDDYRKNHANGATFRTSLGSL